MDENEILCKTCKWYDESTSTCRFTPFMTETIKLVFPKIASKVNKCGRYKKLV